MKKYYNSPKKINKLLNLGYLSSLHDTIESCIVYGLDKGEKNITAHTDVIDDFLRFDLSGEEYKYLFRDNKWYCYRDQGYEIILKC